MVAPAFPLAKLGVLVIKQISKPLANSLAKRAKSSKFFRNYVCIPVGQIFHWADVKVRMRILNLGKVTKVPKLDEQKAIDTGAQLMSEFIILSIGAAILIYEYTRQSAKEDVKQAAIEREKQELRDQVDHIAFTVEQQAAQIRELSRITIALRDDLEKTNKKNSGFFGLGGGSKGSNDTEVKQVSYENKPITSAVLQMNLHSA